MNKVDGNVRYIDFLYRDASGNPFFIELKKKVTRKDVGQFVEYNDYIEKHHPNSTFIVLCKSIKRSFRNQLEKLDIKVIKYTNSQLFGKAPTDFEAEHDDLLSFPVFVHKNIWQAFLDYKRSFLNSDNLRLYDVKLFMKPTFRIKFSPSDYFFIDRYGTLLATHSSYGEYISLQQDRVKTFKQWKDLASSSISTRFPVEFIPYDLRELEIKDKAIKLIKNGRNSTQNIPVKVRIFYVPVWFLHFWIGKYEYNAYVVEMESPFSIYAIKDESTLCRFCGSEHLNAFCSCGLVICQDHIHHCDVCGKLICSKCENSCKSCGGNVCIADTHKCTICGENVCSNCKIYCSCGNFLCKSHVLHCNVCGTVICSICGEKKRVDIRRKWFCGEHCIQI